MHIPWNSNLTDGTWHGDVCPGRRESGRGRGGTAAATWVIVFGLLTALVAVVAWADHSTECGHHVAGPLPLCDPADRYTGYGEPAT